MGQNFMLDIWKKTKSEYSSQWISEHKIIIISKKVTRNNYCFSYAAHVPSLLGGSWAAAYVQINTKERSVECSIHASVIYDCSVSHIRALLKVVLALLYHILRWWWRIISSTAQAMKRRVLTKSGRVGSYLVFPLKVTRMKHCDGGRIVKLGNTSAKLI